MAKILVADDDSVSRLLANRILSMSGHQVVEAYDGLEVIEKIWLERPELVLLDVMMPQRDGIETLRQLRRIPELRKTRVIMMTAVADRARVTEILALGVTDYLVKPFSPELLRSKVANAINLDESQLLDRDLYRAGIALSDVAEVIKVEMLTANPDSPDSGKGEDGSARKKARRRPTLHYRFRKDKGIEQNAGEG